MDEVIPVIQSVLAFKVAVEFTTVVPVNEELAQIRVEAAAANRSKVSSSESDLGLQLVSISTKSTRRDVEAKRCFLSIEGLE